MSNNEIGYSDWVRTDENKYLVWKRSVPLEKVEQESNFYEISYKEEIDEDKFPPPGVYYRTFSRWENNTNINCSEVLFPCTNYKNGWIPNTYLEIADLWLKEEYPKIKSNADDWRDHKIYLNYKTPPCLRCLLTTRIQIPNLNFVNKKKMWVYHYMNPVEVLYVSYIYENGGPKLRIPKRARYPKVPENWQDPWGDGLDCEGEPEWVDMVVKTGEKGAYIDKLGRAKGTAREAGYRVLNESIKKKNK